MVVRRNPLWEFTLKTYDHKAVEAQSIHLQDTCGANVGVLFTCLWLGRKGYGLSAGEMEEVLTRIVPWDEAVVQGMRDVRRALKQHWSDNNLAGSLRRELKELELLAERYLFEELYQYFSHVPDRELDVSNAVLLTAANLRRYPILDNCWNDESEAIQSWIQVVLPDAEAEFIADCLSRVE